MPKPNASPRQYRLTGRSHLHMGAAANKLLMKSWDEKDYDRHVAKICRTKAITSTGPPKKAMHVIQKLKPMQMDLERRSQVQRQNRILLEKMWSVMKRENETMKANPYRGKSLNRHQRQLAVDAIARDNCAMMQRLVCVRPEYDYNTMKLHAKKHADNLAYISRYKPPKFRRQRYVRWPKSQMVTVMPSTAPHSPRSQSRSQSHSPGRSRQSRSLSRHRSFKSQSAHQSRGSSPSATRGNIQGKPIKSKSVEKTASRKEGDKNNAIKSFGKPAKGGKGKDAADGKFEGRKMPPSSLTEWRVQLNEEVAKLPKESQSLAQRNKSREAELVQKLEELRRSLTELTNPIYEPGDDDVNEKVENVNFPNGNEEIKKEKNAGPAKDDPAVESTKEATPEAASLASVTSDNQETAESTTN